MTYESPGDQMRSHDEHAEMEEQYRQRKLKKRGDQHRPRKRGRNRRRRDTATAEVYEVNETGKR